MPWLASGVSGWGDDMTQWVRTGSRPVAGSAAASGKSLRTVRQAWNVLATADPLWAVCVDRARRAGSWERAEFMASGEAEVASAMERVGQLGLGSATDSALDFGCGVGRLTAALAGFFVSVTGVDIAEAMLAQARDVLAADPRCAFVLNDEPDLRIFADGSFDLVYCSLVLQHLPGDVAAGYLREFVRVLRPGGAIVVVVPQSHRGTPQGIGYALLPQPVIGLVQRKLFGYPAAMQMRLLPARKVRRIVEAAGGRLVASDPAPCVGPHWRGYRHIITKD
jgi:ubiquinone/menaquinone biosynthesis C-methylase UbiE